MLSKWSRKTDSMYMSFPTGHMESTLKPNLATSLRKYDLLSKNFLSIYKTLA